MTYFSDYDLVLLDIMKNGSSRFISLFEYVLGKEKDKPVFIREPQLFITVVRNPYDRLVSQFYHCNKRELWNDYRYAIHYPFFRKWVKETYGNGYDGVDGHYYPQSYIIQYKKYPDLPYHIFKIEELKPYELFFFLGELSLERKADIAREYKELGQSRINDKHYATNNIKQGIWQTFYDSETIGICNEYFADDFEVFNYEIIDPNKWETPKRSIV
jgi:hypothetical protein